MNLPGAATTYYGRRFIEAMLKALGDVEFISAARCINPVIDAQVISAGLQAGLDLRAKWLDGEL